MRHLILPVLLAMTTPACAASPFGEWSGDRTVLTLSAEGGTVRQDCAEGRFGPVRPDARGAFAIDGSYAAGGPGPQAGDEMGGGHARYEGRTEGDRLHLVIRPHDGPPQTLTLVRGRHEKLIRCY